MPPRREFISWLQSKRLHQFNDIRLFVALMCFVIAVQGAYLGYIVGVLTDIEKRFELSSSRSGLLLSMYDIGHTSTVLFVGQFLANRHKPRWTAVGVLISSLAMFSLTLPNWIFGSSNLEIMEDDKKHIRTLECNPYRKTTETWNHNPGCSSNAHDGAYAILCLAQLLAGIAAAPFNTVAYIYIDENVEPRKSPFYLGLLTSMYAFGPAFGFGLSAWCNSMFVSLQRTTLDTSSPDWIGAWWLGFIICSIAYLILAAPLFFFPKRIHVKKPHLERIEMETMMNEAGDRIRKNGKNEAVTVSLDEIAHHDACTSICDTVKAIPYIGLKLLKNPVYSCMVIAWIFGSYLVGGYATYLPKYIETQYYQAAWAADLYAGLISIGSVAVSTACGGYILTRFNISPKKSLICLIGSWSVIVITYLLGMISGCVQPTLQGQHINHGKWNFTTPCNTYCQCNGIHEFSPVCDRTVSYFSPCHAGCKYDTYRNMWTDCSCTTPGSPYVSTGYCNSGCSSLPIYLSIMFIGFFIGNIFFMTTMMIVLRCVQEDERSMALSLASFLTNLAGFIPSPIIFGSIIDTTCEVWHSICPDKGNCILYNNQDFRLKYHISNAAFQLLAVLGAIATWYFARKFQFPEELEQDEEDENRHE